MQEMARGRLGLGTLRFPIIEDAAGKRADVEKIEQIVRTAHESGVNYIDCAPTYCGGQCEKIVGKAVSPFRKEIMLASKIPLDALKRKGDLRRILEGSLKRFGTDYLDYYFFWGVKKKEFDEVALSQNFLEEMRHAKEEKLIRRMAFSFHDKPEYAVEIMDAAVNRDCPFDAMLGQYNLIDRGMEDCLAEAKRRGMENFVMGAAAGGKLEYEPAYRFVWSNPDVDCLLSGVDSVNMLRENVRLEQSFSCMVPGMVRDVWAKIAKETFEKQKLSELYCTGCGYCMPCPAGIRIPEWMDACQTEIVHGNPARAEKKRQHFRETYGNPAQICKKCGQCEKKCPQGIRITDYIV